MKHTSKKTTLDLLEVKETAFEVLVLNKSHRPCDFKIVQKNSENFQRKYSLIRHLLVVVGGGVSDLTLAVFATYRNLL